MPTNRLIAWIRWNDSRARIRRAIWAARAVVIAIQLREMRQTAP